jgi:hypothetical protein
MIVPGKKEKCVFCFGCCEKSDDQQINENLSENSVWRNVLPSLIFGKEKDVVVSFFVCLAEEFVLQRCGELWLLGVRSILRPTFFICTATGWWKY